MSPLRYRCAIVPDAILLNFQFFAITAPLEKPARICRRKRDTVFLDSTSFVTLTQLALPLGAGPLPTSPRKILNLPRRHSAIVPDAILLIFHKLRVSETNVPKTQDLTLYKQRLYLSGF